MKKLFAGVMAMVCAAQAALGQGPILRQFGTTNDPTALTNIVKSLATNVVNNNSSPQVWTNDPSVGLYPVDFNNLGIVMTLTNGSSLGHNFSGTFDTWSGNALAAFNLGGNVSKSRSYALNSYNQLPGSVSGATYFQTGSTGTGGQSGSGHGGAANGAIGVNGYASGNDGLLIGVLGEADPSINASTNIGVLGNVVDEGKTGPMIGGYFEIGSDAGSDPVFTQSGALVLSTRNRHDLSTLVAENIGYKFPLTNLTSGQVFASDGGTPQQIYGVTLPTTNNLVRTNETRSLSFSGSNWLTGALDLEFELRTTNAAGTTGQLLTSAGPGKAPYWAAAPSSGAATSEAFVTVGNTSGLSAERALTSGQISVTDGGANSTVTIGATTDTPQFARLGLGQAADGTVGLSETMAIAASTITDGLILSNSTTATSGNPTWSPANEFVGQGFSGAAHTHKGRNYLRTVSGSDTAFLRWEVATNGSAYHTVFDIDSVGNMTNTMDNGSAALYLGKTSGGLYFFPNVGGSAAKIKAEQALWLDATSAVGVQLSVGGTVELTINTGSIAPKNGTLVVAGSIQGKILNITKTANYTATTTDSGGYFNNIGASGTTTNTLPASAAGLHYHYYVDAAQNLTIQAVGSDTIRNVGTVSAAAGNIFSSTVGSTLHLYCPAVGKWIIDTISGTWTGPQ